MHPISFATGTPDGAIVRYLRVRGLVLNVVTVSNDSAALVTDTFSPPGMMGVTETAPTSEPDVTLLDLVRPPGDVGALLEEASRTGRAGTFELTRDFRQARYDGDGWTVFTLKDTHSDEEAALVRTPGRVVLVRPPSQLGDRWLTRVIRDIATRAAKAAGSLVLHSSAFFHRGGAYLVVGDSGAGKSTTAVALARLLPDAGWMGNDRMHLDRAGDGFEVTACPLPLAINKGSLDVMGVTGFETWAVRAGLPGPASDWDQFQGEDKLKLSTREVERHLAVQVVPNGTLAGVILPQVDRRAPYFCEPAAPDRLEAVLGRNCFSLDDNLYGEDWLGVPLPAPLAPPSLAVFLKHLQELPVLNCNLGRASDVARLADDFRAALAR